LEVNDLNLVLKVLRLNFDVPPTAFGPNFDLILKLPAQFLAKVSRSTSIPFSVVECGQSSGIVVVVCLVKFFNEIQKLFA
jgi:hypothetical protein